MSSVLDPGSSKTKTKTKKQNSEENVLVRSEDVFLGFSKTKKNLGFFWFFFYHLTLDKVNSKKQTCPSFFWFFGSWSLKNQKN